jgi:hypothetical protein
MGDHTHPFPFLSTPTGRGVRPPPQSHLPPRAGEGHHTYTYTCTVIRRYHDNDVSIGNPGSAPYLVSISPLPHTPPYKFSFSH